MSEQASLGTRQCPRCRKHKAVAGFKGKKACPPCLERRSADHAAKAVETNARRRERYRSDPEHRSALIALAAQYRKTKPYVRSPAQRAKDKESLRAYQIANRERINALASNARARKLGAPGVTTDQDWEEILEYFAHRCAYCLRTESEVGTLAREHMQPLTRGGDNWPGNIVPACKSCNSSKRVKTVLEFSRFFCHTSPTLIGG